MGNLLGVSSIFFQNPTTKDWDSLVSAGFSCVEICLNSHDSITQMLKNAEKILGETKGKLSVQSVHLPFGRYWDISTTDVAYRKETLNNLRTILKWASQWEIPIAVLHGSGEPVDDSERKERITVAANSIRELSAYANSVNVDIAVENLPRTCLGNTSDEILQLTGNGETAGICLDVNHLLIETHQAFLQKTGKLVIATHFSDYDGKDEKHWFIGKGIVPWKQVVNILKDSGYNGSFLFELSQKSSDLGEHITPKRLADRFSELVSA